MTGTHSVNKMAAATTSALADNDTQDRQGSTLDIPGRLSEKLLVAGLGLFCFGFLIGLVLVDMRRKARTGELRETGYNLLWMLKQIPLLLWHLMLLIPWGVWWLWLWFTDLFRKEENKRRRKLKDMEQETGKERDSAAIIARLAAKATEEPIVKVEEVDETSGVLSDQSRSQSRDAISPVTRETKDSALTLAAGSSEGETQEKKAFSEDKEKKPDEDPS